MNLPVLGERTFDSLPITTIDISASKRVLAQMHPFMKTLLLWEKKDYDAVGDYTQAQVESRVLELLGNNPEQVLLSLFVTPPAPKAK